uniref:Uncharacterized protein n=1 Tax=Glossina palpalis gambiensis TaxID=67801 RepID=A0A1B0C383_9MUSC
MRQLTSMRSSIEKDNGKGKDAGSPSSMLCSGMNLDLTNAVATFLRSSEMLYELVELFAIDS